MANNGFKNQNPEELRRKANIRLEETAGKRSMKRPKGDETQYELELHRVELEMQNEELRCKTKKLAATQKEYYDLYDSAPFGYLNLDKKGRVINANRAACEILAQSTSFKLEGQLLSSLIHVKDLKALKEALDTVSKRPWDRKRTELVLTVAHPGDRQMYVRLHIGTALDDNEQFDGWLIALSDITEIKEAERALRDKEATIRRQFEELQAIYDSAPVGLCVFDRFLRFRRVNDRMAEMNGLPAADHIGKTPGEVVPDLADTAERLAEELIKTGKPVFDIEMEGTTGKQPGVTRYWKEHWLPLKGKSEEVIAISVVAEEITERKENERKIRQAYETLEKRVQERTSELESANINLRNINQELQAEVSRHKKTTEDLEKRGEELLTMSRQRDYLSRMMVDLLERDRRDIGSELHDEIGQLLTGVNMQLEEIKNLEPEDHYLLVSQLSEVQKYLFQAMNRARDMSHQLRAEVLDRFGFIPSVKELVDEMQRRGSARIKLFMKDIPDTIKSDGLDLTLFRLIQETLNNAIKHAKANQISISIIKRDRKLCLSIEDDGTGFDYEQLTSNIDPSRRPLGIVIMRERTALAGGQFHIETAPGKGTHILAEFPLDDTI